MAEEAQTQNLILDWLAAKHILAFRMNVGGMSGEYKGKRWAVQFGVRGMADILAFLTIRTGETDYSGEREVTYVEPLWIEVKAAKGKQSEFQKSFQEQVERAGHRYILAKSLDDVIAAME